MNPPRSRLYRAGRLLASVLLATGLFAAAAHADERAQALTIGTTVRGEITSADRLNYNNGSRSKLYRFNGKAGEVLSFQVSGVLSAQLAVYADGQSQAQSKTDDSEAATLAYRVESDQVYVLAVSGIDHQAYGPFRLTSERLELYSGGTLTPDVTITDLLSGSPREIPLMIETAGLYQIDQRSDAFDTKLELSGNGVSESNDDGGDGTNSRLLVQLQPGRYTLKAGGYSDSARGMYTLSVVAWILSEGVELRSGGALPLNGELNGLLNGENHYTLQLNSRQLVTIDLKSDMFDAYLELSGNGVSEENDDGGDRLNARIRTILEPGTYQITAKRAGTGSSRSRSGAGLFQLSASGRDVPEGVGTGAALVLGAQVSANLLEGLSNRHAFNVSRRGEYVIEMRSNDIDSVLRLYRDGELIARDDDSGDGLNARIEEELAPGAYVVEASSYDSEGGDYRIVARRN